MSIYDSSYCGSIWHHGIKGQKWGVRRTPEQLGHSTVAKSGKSAKIVDGVYHSPKGFTAAVAKLAKYCLNPEKKHSKEFFDVGYKTTDADLLFEHIEKGFDVTKKRGVMKIGSDVEKFNIPMELGVTKKKMFTTAWQIDAPGAKPRLTSAYRDRRAKEGK